MDAYILFRIRDSSNCFRPEHTNILKRLIALLLKGRRLQRITIITVVSDEKS